jgi:hypothetical protein
MNLSELYNKRKSFNEAGVTDKGTYHDYIDGYYNKEFTNREKDLTILEIGVQEGYSVDLWREWFYSAHIYCIDINRPDYLNRINMLEDVSALNANAFSHDTIMLFINRGIMFDYIIEDGPHTLDTQLFAIEHWTKLLKPAGKLIIEDIQNYDNDIPQIQQACTDNNFNCRIYDLRSNKDRYDDVLVEIAR